MITAVIGFFISLFSCVYTVIKVFSKNSKSYFNREMETYYIGTNN